MLADKEKYPFPTLQVFREQEIAFQSHGMVVPMGIFTHVSAGHFEKRPALHGLQLYKW